MRKPTSAASTSSLPGPCTPACGSTLEEIAADIRAIEAETDGLLDEIIGGKT